jgi:hypothetical protein
VRGRQAFDHPEHRKQRGGDAVRQQRSHGKNEQDERDQV